VLHSASTPAPQCVASVLQRVVQCVASVCCTLYQVQHCSVLQVCCSMWCGVVRVCFTVCCILDPVQLCSVLQVCYSALCSVLHVCCSVWCILHPHQHSQKLGTLKITYQFVSDSNYFIMWSLRISSPLCIHQHHHIHPCAHIFHTPNTQLCQTLTKNAFCIREITSIHTCAPAFHRTLWVSNTYKDGLVHPPHYFTNTHITCMHPYCLHIPHYLHTPMCPRVLSYVKHAFKKSNTHKESVVRPPNY